MPIDLTCYDCFQSSREYFEQELPTCTGSVIDFIHSFIRSFVRSFVHLFIHSFIHSFIML